MFSSHYPLGVVHNKYAEEEGSRRCVHKSQGLISPEYGDYANHHQTNESDNKDARHDRKVHFGLESEQGEGDCHNQRDHSCPKHLQIEYVG